MKKCAGMVVMGLLGLIAAADAAVLPPYGCTGWTLGPELLSNGTFEGDTSGSVPAGWAGGVNIQATNATAHSGTMSMLLNSPGILANTTATIPTQSGKFYHLDLYWSQQYANWGPNLRFSPVSQPGTGGTWPRCVEVFGGLPYSSAYYADDGSVAATEMANGRWPMWRDYTYVTSWQHWEATLQVLPNISDVSNALQMWFWTASGTGTTWRVDDISLREWVPEPASGLIFGLLAAGFTRMRRRAPRA